VHKLGCAGSIGLYKWVKISLESYVSLVIVFKHKASSLENTHKHTFFEPAKPSDSRKK